MTLNYFVWIIAMFLTWQCTSELKIDVEKNTPKTVIEGVVSDSLGFSYVRVSKSTGFYETNNDKMVEHAQVFITDLNTLTTTEFKYSNLLERYHSNAFIGMVGHTYRLDVILDGVTYSAQDQIPTKVKLDSIEQIKQTKLSKPTVNGDYTVELWPRFTDPNDPNNHYYYDFYVNGSSFPSFGIKRDLYSNGQPNFNTYEIEADINDTVTLLLQCINQPLYQYYEQLILNQGIGNASPANPKNQFTHNAFGLFKAVSLTSKKIILKKL